MGYFTNDESIKYAVNKYSDMIIRIAFQHVRNRADAEDIMQEVFFSLIKQTSFDDEEHLKAWLIRVTINKCKNYIKSMMRRKMVALEKIDYAMSERHTEVIEEIQQLTEKDRNIIYLFYYEGYSAKEIADILGKRESAILMRLSRARDKLKYLLEKQK